MTDLFTYPLDLPDNEKKSGYRVRLKDGREGRTFSYFGLLTGPKVLVFFVDGRREAVSCYETTVIEEIL